MNRDIKSYQEVIATFNIPALNERFEFIRQLGNVFLIQPEVLKSYITEGYLGRIDAALLKPYLSLRSDWGTFEKGFDSTTATPLGDSASSPGIKDRFGRLSVMMKELEGLKVEVPALPAMPSMPAGFAGSFSRLGGST